MWLLLAASSVDGYLGLAAPRSHKNSIISSQKPLFDLVTEAAQKRSRKETMSCEAAQA